MNVTAYAKMSYEELTKEIDKQKRKIKIAQETIKLLEKLLIAEKSKPTKGSNNQQKLHFQDLED